MCIGKNTDGFCFASESVALGKYTYVRELEAGELVRLNSKQINIETIYLEPKELEKKHICLFEYIYLQRKDSLVKQKESNKIQVEDCNHLLRSDIRGRRGPGVDIEPRPQGEPALRGRLGTRYPKPAFERLIRPRARSDGSQTSHQRHQMYKVYHGTQQLYTS